MVFVAMCEVLAECLTCRGKKMTFHLAGFVVWIHILNITHRFLTEPRSTPFQKGNTSLIDRF